ncbi:hypothetical protein [Paenibacillus sp. FSL P2-0173]|uniref:hypothetical protein n=1 Tax=Paenibacillus sp. FSL P2-0173 TaxID=2921627 RepID=UPI0030F635BB
MKQINVTDKELELIIAGLESIESEFGLNGSEEQFLEKLKSILKRTEILKQ